MIQKSNALIYEEYLHPPKTPPEIEEDDLLRQLSKRSKGRPQIWKVSEKEHFLQVGWPIELSQLNY